ncbi:MAG: hypothetical protein K8F25_07460 [Fimbriimonadaceae bacterium]|nr:hypothetical protein [Alphaproteobacteria bacterium]
MGRIISLTLATAYLATLAGCTSLSTHRGAALINMQGQIEIEAPIRRVFAFAGNPMNDHLWRAEVLEMKSSGPLRVGTVYTETASLGLVRGYMTPVRVSALRMPTRLYVETLSSHPRRFFAERVFQRLSATRTRVIYRISVDAKMVSDVWPVPLLPDVAKTTYETRLRLYLLRLKRLLEARYDMRAR